MTIRVGVSLVGLAALLAVAAPCAGTTVAEPAAQPAAQAQIERLVATIVAANEGGPDGEIPAMAEQLQRLTDNDRESLLVQLVLYLATHGENEPAMATALLIDYYGLTNDEKIAALAPHLDTDDARLRDVMWDVMSTVDRPQGGQPDFGPYEAVLSEGDDAPSGLIRYMYAVSPLDALSATARAYARDEAAEAAVHRARELDELRVQLEQGGVVDPERMRSEIDTLSRDAAWWVRLYVAHVVRMRPDLGSPEIVNRLRSDAHELVRDAVVG